MCSFYQTTIPFAVAPAELPSVYDHVLVLGNVIQPTGAWCWSLFTTVIDGLKCPLNNFIGTKFYGL